VETTLAASTYVIKGGRDGRERLRVLSSALTATTGALLNRLAVAQMIARRHPEATVVGLDFDAEKVDIARTEARRAGVTNVAYRVHDVTCPFPDAGTYDAVYARFLLSHMVDPGHVAGLAVAAARPGATIAVEDVDIAGAACDPPCPAFERTIELFSDLMRSRGADPQIGFRVPAILRAAGVVELDVAVVQPAALSGDAKQIQLLTLLNVREAAVGAGLADDAEIDQLAAELASFVDRPDTVATTARIVQSWGVVPDR
jgi:SAM-dependent methyltransferase